MSQQTVELALGIVVIIAVFTLLWRLLEMQRSGSWKMSVGDIFKSEFTIDPDRSRVVEENVSRANRERKISSESPITLPTSIRPRRILWVDDRPDNNVYETIALESIGAMITTATSSGAAFRYLAGQQYDAVITDLGRGEDPIQGFDFIAAVASRYPTVRIIVYTTGAEQHQAAARQAGAYAALDCPAPLVAAVVAER